MEKINFEKCLYKISNIYKLKYKIIFWNIKIFIWCLISATKILDCSWLCFPLENIRMEVFYRLVTLLGDKCSTRPQ